MSDEHTLKRWQFVSLRKIYSRLEENTPFLEPPDWFRDLIFSVTEQTLNVCNLAAIFFIRVALAIAATPVRLSPETVYTKSMLGLAVSHLE